jgi:ABC-type lipoprotein export system ATPase subunit
MNIEICNITLPFTGQLLENGKTEVLEKGEKYSIKSPSGTGKSTLIHVIYGLVKEYEGSYRIGQTDTKFFSIHDWANLRRMHMSVVFQGFRLIPDSSALENIQLKNRLTSQFSATEIENLAKRLDISCLLDRKVSQLSFGQQQRVAIIRALSQPFHWILLDEPFAHLDKENMTKALQLITEVAEHNKAGIIIADTKSNPLLADFYEIKLATDVYTEQN